MKYTAPDRLPYPEPTDDFLPADQWFKNLADAVQAAIADTGWIGTGFTTASGATVESSVAVRSVGKVATLVIPSATLASVRVLNTGVVSGGAAILTVPKAFAPARTQSLGTVNVGGSSGRFGSAVITSNGVVSIVGVVPNVTQTSTTTETNMTVGVAGTYLLN